MTPFAVTIFLSAFLLFQLQPMIGKFILPWFGGTPAVWTTCVLFFQSLLVAGYAYAHAAMRTERPRRQAVVHGLLLAASLAFLPITPSQSWKPAGDEAPVARILGLLAAAVGVPYLLLASTGPLMQAWFGRAQPGASPYRLFALSNAGSLLGLLSYPFLVEPNLALGAQTVVWSVGYGAFVLCSGWCATIVSRLPAAPSEPPATNAASADDSRPGFADRLLWLLLPMCGSVLLLAVTNLICQDVAAIPFLWVLPLVLYLLSFILCFDHPRWYSRVVWGAATVVAAAATLAVLDKGAQADRWRQLGCYSAILFSACMICHGELARLKPAASGATGFLLSIAVGGAAGGVLVSVVAPLVFRGLWEFPIGLSATALLFLVSLFRDPKSPMHRGSRPWVWEALLVTTAALLFALFMYSRRGFGNSVETTRNFYGVLAVREYSRGDPQHQRRLVHGRITHGVQLLDPALRRRPTGYFGPESGAGLAIARHPHRDRGLRIGVIGLGAGTMAAHGRAGDVMRFYEIDPDVVRLSAEHFTFRADSEAKIEVVVGDGRIRLERELAESGPQQFDVLILDAFSGDAIPMHLLTRECFDLYWKHLKPDGVLAVHISNIHLDLAPVVRGPADEAGKSAVLAADEGDARPELYASNWMLVTSDRRLLADPDVKRHIRPWSASDPPPMVWTDDFSNLLSVLK